MDEHPITPPPPELVAEWVGTIYQQTEDDDQRDLYIATRAAQWGADQELEACCEVLARELICDGKHVATDLRMIRRSKLSSLKEQALDALTLLCKGPDTTAFVTCRDTIRRALEALPE
jgi:hypothetical protein